MLIPSRFIVPCLITWPKEHWGLKLGGLVDNIRRGKTYADKKGKLEAAGFVFAVCRGAHNVTGWVNLKLALLAYKEQNGHFNMVKSFTVPHDDPHWPESTWGIQLGDVVRHIRNGSTYKTHKQDLLDMGFNYTAQSFSHATGWEELEPALPPYSDDSRWPESTRGIKLGNIVKSIRIRDSYKAHRTELEAMGIVY